MTRSQRFASLQGRRGVAAAVAVVLFLVQVVGSLFHAYGHSAGQVYGFVEGFFHTVSSSEDWIFSNALYALSTAVSLIPLTMLAGVLVWVWLRAHPVAASASGGATKV